jgi:hypothetical protein
MPRCRISAVLVVLMLFLLSACPAIQQAEPQMTSTSMSCDTLEEHTFAALKAGTAEDHLADIPFVGLAASIINGPQTRAQALALREHALACSREQREKQATQAQQSQPGRVAMASPGSDYTQCQLCRWSDPKYGDLVAARDITDGDVLSAKNAYDTAFARGGKYTWSNPLTGHSGSVAGTKNGACKTVTHTLGQVTKTFELCSGNQ